MVPFFNNIQHIILISLLVIISSIKSENSSIYLEFNQQYFVRDEFTQLKIKTSNIDLSQDILLLPDFALSSTNEFTTSKHYLYQFPSFSTQSPSSSKLISFGVLGQSLQYIPNNNDTTTQQQFPCLDSTTGQIFAFIYGGGDQPLTITKANQQFHSLKYNSTTLPLKCGSFEFICPLLVSNIPHNPNIVTNFIDCDGIEQFLDVNLSPPSQGFITPQFSFHHLSISTQKRFSTTSEIKFEFITEFPGTYNITISNGFQFQSILLPTNKQSNYWCSSSSNDEFARIILPLPDSQITQFNPTTALIIVPTSSNKEVIKCKIPITFTPTNNFIRSERTTVSIQLGKHRLSRTVHVPLIPAHFHANLLFNTFETNRLNLSITTPSIISMSSTAININSTIEFKFSNHFDLTTTQFYTGYRNFTGCNNFNATISIHDSSLVLHDILPFVPITHLTCIFEFFGPRSFIQAKDSKFGTLQIIIDGQRLHSASENSDSTKLYLFSPFDVETPITTQGLYDDIYHMIVATNIKSVPLSFVTTPSKPILLLSFRNSIPFSYETHSQQLTCEISTPTSSTLHPLQLEFDENTLIWSAPLDSIVDHETFNLLLKCQFNIPRIIHYGLNITPNTTLFIEVIDIINKYNQFGSNLIQQQSITTMQESSPIQITQYDRLQAGQYAPKRPQYQILFHAPIQLTTKPITFDHLEQCTNTFTSDLSTALSSSFQSPTLYSFEPQLRTVYQFPQQMSFYIDPKAGPNINNFDINILHNEWVPSATLIPQSFQYQHAQSLTFHHYVTIPTSIMSQWFIIRPIDEKLNNITIDNSTHTKIAFKLWELGENRQVDQDVMFLFPTNLFTPNQTNSLPYQYELIFANELEGCGYKLGLHLIPPPTNITNTTNSTTIQFDQDYKYDDYSKWPTSTRRHSLCFIYDKCQTTMDCLQLNSFGPIVCKSGICTPLPQKISPYNKIASQFSP